MAESTPADTSTLSAAPSAIPSAVASTVGTPQSMPPMDPEERAKSLNVSLADMVAKATALYHSKKYEEAAEIFSTATERQAELNGEMAPENADVLFLYGRCLFKVGQSNSDVLGGKAPGDKMPKTKKPQAESSTAGASRQNKTAAEAATGAAAEEEKVPDAKKPLFQFNGDENFEDSDEDEEVAGEDGEEEGEEEDDDLAVAFEILELSRILFEKQLEETATTEGPDKDVAADENKLVRHTKERLADIHDLLAEISLENEKFPEAIKDCRASLGYKKKLYPVESEIIAEAHFKLSLALEFASMTTTSSEDDADAAPKTVDEAMRAEAADELEKAIDSTKLKLQNKEVELATSHAPEDNDETRRQITDVKEIIADMEQRLIELRKPPVDMGAALGQDNPLSGLLGQGFGESSSEQAARVEEAKKSAKDLTGLVRKKAKPEPEAEPEGSNGKRKAEEPAEGQDAPKKAKSEEPTAALS
ncbi:putative histone h1-binding protein [Rosellinia necatrix]|uniref:Putative histone h1-binding protein n=1 Tax=Rosellinia necatrix TaxID=77044 RepID=A0A1W2TXI8_ROSNE|nr:putative histone h1-binding protein [Rosellinia necatrix]